MSGIVSIITPVFNSSQFIAKAIESVVNQTYKDWELIIVDDASWDASIEIIEEFKQKDSRIRFFRLDENQGAAFCRNLATEKANGKYIAFLDSDDLWKPEKLQIQTDFMEQNNCDVCFSNYLHIDENGNPLHKRVIAKSSLSYKKQRLNNYIGNLTGIYNAESLGKILAPKIRKRQDWAVWLEAIHRSGKPALGIQQDLAFYRVRKGSVSANKWKLINYNFLFYRDYLKYSYPKSFYFLLLFFWEYFMQRPKYIEKLK
ncbi:glycosyltransferase family 2 protein [Aequorivita echinoideorum]|uniref:Glycosyltransferase family 2 protein n=1 Tax=Aequorivita echinoideorum TaxID=1549647 RepID=A0ABS5S1T9_9FLAO|nr:glycosyltransferase family 2 protein [Aequorivita echinoideorum]MBT0607168.1 glycosyltransferase family 2 protein [Aequorivita echinoideorum]